MKILKINYRYFNIISYTIYIEFIEYQILMFGVSIYRE